MIFCLRVKWISEKEETERSEEECLRLCDLCLKSVARDICICIVNISCVVLLRLTLTRNKMDYLSN